MITAAKLNNSIVFCRATFWGLRADEMGPEGRGSKAEDKGRGTRVEKHKHPQKMKSFALLT